MPGSLLTYPSSTNVSSVARRKFDELVCLLVPYVHQASALKVEVFDARYFEEGLAFAVRERAAWGHADAQEYGFPAGTARPKTNG